MDCPYANPNTILTDHNLQFVPSFIAALCAALGTRLVATTEYHLQASSQVKRFNKSLEARLRQYIYDHRRRWDMFIQSLTYGYNTQEHQKTSTSPLSLILSWMPLGPIALDKIATLDEFVLLRSNEARLMVAESMQLIKKQANNDSEAV